MFRIYTAVLALTLSFSAAADDKAFGNLCPDPSVSYCKDVGKRAYNAIGAQAMRDIDLGPILGTTFKRMGAVVSAPGRSIRLSSRDAWYYIIGSGGVATYPFLREAREITPR